MNGRSPTIASSAIKGNTMHKRALLQMKPERIWAHNLLMLLYQINNISSSSTRTNSKGSNRWYNCVDVGVVHTDYKH